MKTSEVLKQMNNQEFLDKIYHFSYHRCNSSHEAEDLCSEIILAVISSVQKQDRIENFYAFVWTIARRVYADYCEKRQKESQNAFLSKAYREVMVMYYLDEMKVKEIADRLKISETTVKQRLFSARNIVRKEVETMNSHTLTLKPRHLLFGGREIRMEMILDVRLSACFRRI